MTSIAVMLALRLQTVGVLATAYDTSKASNGGYTITKTGHPLGDGVIAADPRVFPMGTVLLVQHYGKGLVLDTGGAIRGHRIDVCAPGNDRASRHWVDRWGRRRLKVTVLGRIPINGETGRYLAAIQRDRARSRHLEAQRKAGSLLGKNR